ncbi:hypothetical protein [uncultured Lutibacter sp.]|uniref:hypothetical protein n=1 Tax=uncultured Lutibacter sp. TaxID=437739 RepID=UPI00262DB102|nr:hypothetical protein [uncultured Lutibacter sp.]
MTKKTETSKSILKKERKVEKLKDKTLIDLSFDLKIPFHHFIQILKYLKINKADNDKPDLNELENILNFIKDNKGNLPPKKNLNLKKKDSHSVYDKINKNKGIGKVIYIRKS